MEKCKTQIIKNAIPKETADNLYDYLKDNANWVESIKSRRDRENGGFTRFGCLINIEEYPAIQVIVSEILDKVQKNKNHKGYIIGDVYLNWYKDGTMWSPNHSHKGVHSLVISTGVTRQFVLGKKIIDVENGDAVMFGSAIHGIPKQSEIKGGRISIAVFLVPIQ